LGLKGFFEFSWRIGDDHFSDRIAPPPAFHNFETKMGSRGFFEFSSRIGVHQF
jgi:hypothetical protein